MTPQRPIERIQPGDPTGRPVYDARRADAYTDHLEDGLAEWQDRSLRLAEEAMHWKERALLAERERTEILVAWNHAIGDSESRDRRGQYESDSRDS